jgi:hypothetical protein
MKLYPHLAFLLFALSVHSQTATVISENANLRGTPSEKGKVVETLRRDTQVAVIKQKDAWFLVQSTEYVGWLHGNTIRLADDNAGGGNATVTERVTPTAPEPKYVYVPRSDPQPRTYFRGPRGGCYYINSSGKKTYVDHSLCN